MQDFFILQGTNNVLALFKQRSLSAFVVHATLLCNVFRLSRAAAAVYHNDDSGEYPKPHPDSQVEARNRVDFLTRTSFHRFLAGPGLASFSKRFEHSVTKRFHSLRVGHGWVQWDDLMDLFHHEVTSSVIDAMCGTFLLERHPAFLEDFWTLDHNLMTMFCRTPRILAPRAYAARDRMLAAVQTWHTWARENFDPASIDLNGDDPYWGTRFFRDRQAMFYGMEGFDADAVASQELAFIWG
jgi:hypothetical protein